MDMERNYKKIIVIAIALIAVFGGYSVWKSYSDQKGINEGERIDIPAQEIDRPKDPAAVPPVTNADVPTSDDRDNQRVKDIGDISFAIDEYAKFNKNEYPVTNGYEKISDENSNVYKLLSQDGYLKKNYQDPLPGSYFYGYRSDGKSYELTAALEDSNDLRCKNIGNYCVYSIKKP